MVLKLSWPLRVCSAVQRTISSVVSHRHMYGILHDCVIHTSCNVTLFPHILLAHCHSLFLITYSLHNEIVAQRALDRRLADELNRFKNAISSLTRLL